MLMCVAFFENPMSETIVDCILYLYKYTFARVLPSCIVCLRGSNQTGRILYMLSFFLSLSFGFE